jgi:hypothetical protein
MNSWIVGAGAHYQPMAFVPCSDQQDNFIGFGLEYFFHPATSKPIGQFIHNAFCYDTVERQL